MDSLVEKIKALRQRTGAGIVECKRTLLTCNGDLEQAIVLLRKEGIAQAQNKAHREVREGLVLAKKRAQHGAIVEVNCETDFVSRGEPFRQFVHFLLDSLLTQQEQDVLGSQEIQQARDNLVHTTGENIVIKNSELVHASCVGAYNHNNKVACLVTLENTPDQDLAHNVAMQIAATDPAFISTLSEQLVQQETEIYTEKAKHKEAPVVEHIIQGRLKQLASELCLLHQPYLLDPKRTVAEVLGSAVVTSFVRYQSK